MRSSSVLSLFSPHFFHLVWPSHFFFKFASFVLERLSLNNIILPLGRLVFVTDKMDGSIDFLFPRIGWRPNFETIPDYSFLSCDEEISEHVPKQQPQLLQLKLSMQPRQINQLEDNEKVKAKLSRRQLRMRKVFSSSTEELIRIDLIKMIHQIPEHSKAHRQHLARQIRREMWNKSVTEILRIGATISEYASSKSGDEILQPILPIYFNQTRFSQSPIDNHTLNLRPIFRPKSKSHIPSITT